MDLRENINIARGTTDPEIDSVTWIELGNNIAPLFRGGGRGEAFSNQTRKQPHFQYIKAVLTMMGARFGSKKWSNLNMIWHDDTLS